MKAIDSAPSEPNRNPQAGPNADEVLRWLLNYPLLSVEDLAAAVGYSRAQCYRYLAALCRYGWVEAVSVSALGVSRARLYHLTCEGVRELAKREGADPNAFARYFQADEPHLLALLVRAPALVAVQTLICEIVTQAPVALASAHRPSTVAWSWERDYRLSAHARECVKRTPSLLLDAYFMLRASACADSASRQGERHTGQRAVQSAQTSYGTADAHHSVAGITKQVRWFAAFVLHDTGVLSEQMMAQRLLTLLLYREAPERWVHSTAYATFPPLLVLAPSARRAERWRFVARSVTAHAGMDPVRGGVLVMTSQSLANPWNAGWSAFAGATTLRLTELLTPGPSDALMLMPGQREQGSTDANRYSLHCSGQTNPRDSCLSDTALSKFQTPGVRHIIGKYTQRAHQAGGRRGPCMTREKVQRSTFSRSRLALISLRLGARHVDTLRLLLEHPLLSRMELAAALVVDEASAARYLSDLRREGLVSAITARRGTLGWSASIPGKFSQPCLSCDETSPEWAKRQISRRDDSAYDRYFVSVAAIRLLAAGARIRSRSLAHPAAALQCDSARLSVQHTTYDDGLELAYRGCVADGELGFHPHLRFLLRYPAHTAGVYTFFAALLRSIERERSRGHGPELLWWETGAACIRRYHYHERWRNFRPDGAGEYLRDESGSSWRRVAFWLEWDRGTMSVRDLQAKFTSYAEYVTSREWMHDGVHALPRLLVVMSDGKQQFHVIEALESTLVAVPGLTVFLTTAAQIISGDPLSDIWHQWLQSMELGYTLGQPCRALS